MFESLDEIEGLSDDQKTAIQEKLNPAIQQSIKSATGSTFGELDTLLEEFTGVKKPDGQFTSKYAREALGLFKDSFETDVKKRSIETWETEKAELMQRIEKAKDRDQIFNDYQAVSEANKKIQEEYEAKIKEIEAGYEGKIKMSSISSQLPAELNDPIYLPWKQKVSELLIEANVSIENGKVQPCEQTGGIAMSIGSFITKLVPELKGVFEKKNPSIKVNENAPRQSISIKNAETAQQLENLIRDKVCKENGITRTHKDYPALFRKEYNANKEEFERLKK